MSMKILVCGSGNGSHALVSISAAKADLEIRVLTLSPGTAGRWTRICEDNEGTEVSNYMSERKLKSKPLLITNDPEEAILGVNIIILALPAFSHANYLRSLLSYIQHDTIIIGLPGQADFELQCHHILESKAKHCAIISFESLPCTCRILEFGKRVHISAIKETLQGGIVLGSECRLPFATFSIIQNIIGEKPILDLNKNYLVVNLISKSIIHPQIMLGKLESWDGRPFDRIPLFYQEVNERQTNLLSKVSDEIVRVGMKIYKVRPEIDVSPVMHILDWYKRNHDRISDDTNLMMTLRTNKEYDGLLTPMKKAQDGYVPDYSHRYLTEDIPYGLVVMKGIAETVHVPTPKIDEVITWCQKKLEKEYIVGHELKGKDLDSTRAPQVYGFHTLDELLNVQNVFK